MLLLAVHFVIASVVGLLIGLCRPFNPDNSRWCARVYGVPAMWILGLRVKLEDDTVRDHQRSAVIVANHISNYDLMVFGLTVPKRTVSLGKKSLKWIPLFGQLYWLAGNVLVDRGNAIQGQEGHADHDRHLAAQGHVTVGVCRRHPRARQGSAAAQEGGLPDGHQRRCPHYPDLQQQLCAGHATEPLAQWQRHHPFTAAHPHHGDDLGGRARLDGRLPGAHGRLH
jgi:1-acyl-sn-glycerol-3-phosphate acyltransferase